MVFSFKKDLRNLFGLKEADDEQLDDVHQEAPPEPLEDSQTNSNSDNDSEDQLPEIDLDKLESGDENDSNDAETDTVKEPKEEPKEELEEPPESETVSGTGDEIPPESMESDEDKIKSMFTDSGHPETDYGLTNPNNIRLAKFRFKKSGIDPIKMMNEIEQKVGITVENLIFRLTPEQYESYRDRGQELRKKYELLNKREKNIILFNSRIPIFYHDSNTNKLEKLIDTNPNLLKNAYKKIDEFVTQRFGENWVDDLNAIDFVQSIKINFAAKESITPNMLTIKYFEDGDDKLIPFNKLFVKIPKTVDEFVKENKDNQSYLRSSVYRTLAAGYLDESTDSNGVYATIKAESINDNVSKEDSKDENGDEESVDNISPDTEADAAIDEILSAESEPNNEETPEETSPETV